MALKWTIDIRVDPPYGRRVKVRDLRAIVGAALAAEDVPPGKKVSLLLTGDDAVRHLNRQYRGIDRTTDVLSFLLAEGEGDFVSPPGIAVHLGEIVMSYPQAERQALEAGHPVNQELAMLIVHGVLHVLGYDHERPKHARLMKPREQAILGQILKPTLEDLP